MKLTNRARQPALPKKNPGRARAEPGQSPGRDELMAISDGGLDAAAQFTAVAKGQASTDYWQWARNSSGSRDDFEIVTEGIHNGSTGIGKDVLNENCV